MSKFDYMNFSVGGYDTEFVAHAGKYTEEQAINLCIQENDWRFKPNYCNGNLLRVPTICDVKLRYARWYVKTPDFCGYDDDGRGCYSYCKAGQKGSFPVWVIDFYKLKVGSNIHQQL
jgi:hypothetical protein